jgi:hypothetical protein
VSAQACSVSSESGALGNADVHAAQPGLDLALGQLVGIADLGQLMGLIVQPFLVHVEGADHVEDDHAILHRDDAPVGVRAAVAVAVHGEQHPPGRIAAAQEVPVQRMRMPVTGHRGGRGAQCLRRHLTAVQPERLVADRDGPEQVVFDPLEREQLWQLVAGHWHLVPGMNG